MQYSPKLKKAMEEIKSVLKKHDIGALVIIHTPGFCEYLNHVDPSYSCAKVNGDELRFKAKLVDYNGDKEKQRKAVEDTLNMLTHIGTMGANLSLGFLQMEEKVKSQVDWDEDNGAYTSHVQQNN